MTNAVLIALVLGLIAALTFVSATTGPLPVRLILFLITPLPLLLAGLGWGVRAGLIAGVAGAALLLVLSGAQGTVVAGVFLLSQAIPAAVLAYLALLNRPVTADERQAAPADAREWYPAGRLVVWTAIMAAVPASLWNFLADSRSDELKKQLEAALTTALSGGNIGSATGGPLTPEDIAKISAVIYAALPSGTAIAWMSGLLLTLWLAGRIMRSSGQLARPWPDLAALEFPNGTTLAFLAAILMSFLEGPAGLAGRAFFGALFFAYVLLGLAVVHYATRGSAWRPFILWGLYAALFIASGYAAIPVALIGLSDSFMHYRRRFGGPPAPST